MKNRYSYADQKNQRHKTRWIVLIIFLFFLLYTSFTSLFFSTRVLENDTMASNLRYGERLIFSSYSFYSLIPGLELGKGPLPFRRGNVVLVSMFKGESPGLFLRIADGALRFFTAQNVSLLERKEQLFIKRVIGLPGDEITMTNFIIRVKARGSAYNLTEFEVSEQDYTPDIPQLPALWDASLPFSGNMDRIVLKENECFVLSDDRSNTNDSRTWGPVPVKNISGKALFRYWPLPRIGRP
jgi:signal peptidase I